MGKVIIETKNLGKQYGKQFAIKNVDLKIEEGMICGLIGPNGAGKTTIMKILGGLNIPTEGSVSIYGKNTEKGLAESRKRMSFMIETPYIKSRMSAYENLEKQRLQKGIPNKERVDEEFDGKENKTGINAPTFQFMRVGYFCMDNRDSSPEHLVFNRSVSLKDSFNK